MFIFDIKLLNKRGPSGRKKNLLLCSQPTLNLSRMGGESQQTDSSDSCCYPITPGGYMITKSPLAVGLFVPKIQQKRKEGEYGYI